MAEDIADAARALLLSGSHGVLSTHSKDEPGYPFGSLVQYLLDEAGQPVMLISRLAQHTQNLAEDGRCSLTIVGGLSANVQEAARLTWLANAHKMVAPSDELQLRYMRFFPDAADYLSLDFEFWRLELCRARFIGGFGQIHWVPAEQLLLNNPFFGAAEKSMLDHMNEDHVDAMRRYCSQSGVPCSENPEMAGVDAEGFHLRVDGRLIRFQFPSIAETPAMVRQFLVEMARR